jgi:hypothetical protein
MARIDAIRQISIAGQTYYRWRKQYGGFATDRVKELRSLHKENDRLRRAVSDLAMDKLGVSERRACRVRWQLRSTQRRVERGREDEERLVADIIELARQFGRYGYRCVAALLRDASWTRGLNACGGARGRRRL